MTQIIVSQQYIILSGTGGIKANQSLQSHTRVEQGRDFYFTPAANLPVPETTPHGGSWSLLQPCKHFRDTHYYKENMILLSDSKSSSIFSKQVFPVWIQWAKILYSQIL